MVMSNVLCYRNVLKSDKKKGKHPLEATESVTPKRKRKADAILQRYPISCNNVSRTDNSETLAQHSKAISSELSKSIPRDTVLLPLMKYTFNDRRALILEGGNSVKAVLDVYPALSSLAIVSSFRFLYHFLTVISLQIEQEMELVLGSSTKTHFIAQWQR